jgi:hypothetical protein
MKCRPARSQGRSRSAFMPAAANHSSQLRERVVRGARVDLIEVLDHDQAPVRAQCAGRLDDRRCRPLGRGQHAIDR